MNTNQKYLKKSLLVLGILLLIGAVIGMTSGASVQPVQAAARKTRTPTRTPSPNPHSYAYFSTLYHSNSGPNDPRQRNLENCFQPECGHRHIRESAQRGGGGLRE